MVHVYAPRNAAHNWDREAPETQRSRARSKGVEVAVKQLTSPMRLPRLAVLVGVIAVALVLSACSSGTEEVTVVGTDYAFDAPTELSAGETTITFRNDGAVDHEMVLVRLREAGTFDDAIAALQAGGDPDALFEQFFEANGAVVFATPGTTGGSRLAVDLTEGEYAIFCFFQDAPDAPPHVELGMLANFNVS